MANSTCYNPMPAVSNGILQGDIPLNFALPLLIVQISLVLLVTRTMGVLFRPIKQPRVLAEIIGGVILGPTALGRNKYYMKTVFPTQSLSLLETVANVGLMFFIFMVGLGLDLQALKKTGKNAILIAAIGIAVPFTASIGLSALVVNTLSKGVKLAPLIIFLGGPISMSAFSVLVRIMAELKLLSSDMAKVAVPAGAMNDVVIWTLLAVGVATAGTDKSPLTPLWVLLCGAGYATIMFTLVSRFMAVVARRAVRPGEGKEIYICISLIGVLITGFLSDAIGVHPLLGPFMLGLVTPKDTEFPKVITGKIEDFVTGLLLPLFFASSGLKTNLGALHGTTSLAFLMLFFATAATGKIIATFITARFIGFPPRKALIMGFLMNTKGLAVLIVLNIGKDLKVLTDETFAILVLTCLLTSFVTTPAVTALCKGEMMKEGNNHVGGSWHNIETMSTNSWKKELNILSCAYEKHHHASMTSFLESLRGHKISGIKVYAVKLTEMMERPLQHLQISKHWQQSRNNNIWTFRSSSTLSHVSIRHITSLSKFDSMDEDICRLAMKKKTSIILLPHHKPCHSIYDPGFHKVTQKVLEHAPCSVGILVDLCPSIPSFSSFKVVILFVGGPDDRETIHIASRMIGHPGISLKLVRFLLPTTSLSCCETLNDQSQIDHPTSCVHSSLGSVEDERVLDDEVIANFKNVVQGDSSFTFLEEQVSNVGDLEAVKLFVKEMNDVDLFMVGRGKSPHMTIDQHANHVTELGVLGDALASRGDDLHACVLVVQQHPQKVITPSNSSTKVSNKPSEEFEMAP